MRLKIKKTNKEIPTPKFANPGDVGMDLSAVKVIKTGNKFFPIYTYYTGIHLGIPKGYWVMLTPRSSLSRKLMWLANHVGIIDNDYTGELIFKFRSIFGIRPYKVGERIGQMILMKKYDISFLEVDELKKTSRGNKGFGSTGN